MTCKPTLTEEGNLRIDYMYQDFEVKMKRMFQNYYKILNKCVLSITLTVRLSKDSNTQSQSAVLPVTRRFKHTIHSHKIPINKLLRNTTNIILQGQGCVCYKAV